MKWFDITKEKPPRNADAYLVSGHKFFGLCLWKDGKWIDGAFGDLPLGWFISAMDDNDRILKNEKDGHYRIRFWSEIPGYPETALKECEKDKNVLV